MIDSAITLYRGGRLRARERQIQGARPDSKRPRLDDAVANETLISEQAAQATEASANGYPVDPGLAMPGASVSDYFRHVTPYTERKEIFAKLVTEKAPEEVEKAEKMLSCMTPISCRDFFYGKGMSEKAMRLFWIDLWRAWDTSDIRSLEKMVGAGHSVCIGIDAVWEPEADNEVRIKVGRDTGRSLMQRHPGLQIMFSQHDGSLQGICNQMTVSQPYEWLLAILQ